tara:strand:- start:284 stop:526 length:243 start_codon:yes stop_codon:yes gene_type:complete
VEDLEIIEVHQHLQEMVVQVEVDQVTHQIQLVMLQEQETHLLLVQHKVLMGVMDLHHLIQLTVPMLAGAAERLLLVELLF